MMGWRLSVLGRSIGQKIARVIYPAGVTPVSWSIIIVTHLGFLCDQIILVMPFGYLPQLTHHFGYEWKDVGYFAGSIGAAIFLPRVFTMLLWGWLVDIYDKKKIFIASSCILGLTTVMLGFAQSFSWCLACRFIAGLFSGLFTASKLILLDYCEPNNQATAMVLTVTLASSVSLVLGPSIGGFLAFPVDQYPKYFNSSFLKKFPIFLPNCFVGLLFLITSIACYFVVREKKNNSASPTEDTSTTKQSFIQTFVKQSRMLLRNRNFIVSLILYALYGVPSIGYGELFTLWVATETRLFGEGFSPNESGRLFLLSTLIMVAFELLLVNRLIRRYGYQRCCTWALLLTNMLIACATILKNLHSSPVMYILQLLRISILRFLTAMSFITIHMIINASVTPSLAGTSNGLCGSFVSLTRFISPIALCSIYSWSLSNMHRFHASFTIVHNLAFYCASAVSILSAYFVTLLNDSAALPKDVEKA